MLMAHRTREALPNDSTHTSSSEPGRKVGQRAAPAVAAESFGLRGEHPHAGCYSVPPPGISTC